VCLWSSLIIFFFCVQIYLSKKFYKVVDAEDLFPLSISRDLKDEEPDSENEEKQKGDRVPRKDSNGPETACFTDDTSEIKKGL
jgi:hypothetical protein